MGQKSSFIFITVGSRSDSLTCLISKGITSHREEAPVSANENPAEIIIFFWERDRFSLFCDPSGESKGWIGLFEVYLSIVNHHHASSVGGEWFDEENLPFEIRNDAESKIWTIQVRFVLSEVPLAS